ncbi:MAG: hypothetical protein GC160_27970 [Acidobacteria bacterium]|nr:hypothetical protein [Acidobacteriota bacterium]
MDGSALGDTPRWALLADDLSGACDSAVAFAKAGFQARFELDAGGAGADAELLALSTESRELAPDEAARAVGDACTRLRDAGVALVFKKIDSVLRGPVEAEIAAAVEAGGFEGAVVCPAFPSQGRVVRDGRLYVHGEPGPAAPAGELLEWRDAVTDADLDGLAQEILRRPRRLAVGSGGLAAAFARALGALHHRMAFDPPPPWSALPTGFWIGSEHPATLAQLEQLPEGSLIERVDMHLAETDVRPLVGALAHHRIGALVLSGGATARRILDGLGAQAIEIRGEVIAGAPWGTIIGGLADGLTVVTKSGGFGDDRALVRILEILSPS